MSSGNLLLWHKISAGTVPRRLTKKSAGRELRELRVLRLGRLRDDIDVQANPMEFAEFVKPVKPTPANITST